MMPVELTVKIGRVLTDPYVPGVVRVSVSASGGIDLLGNVIAGPLTMRLLRVVCPVTERVSLKTAAPVTLIGPVVV